MIVVNSVEDCHQAQLMAELEHATLQPRHLPEKALIDAEHESAERGSDDA